MLKETKPVRQHPDEFRRLFQDNEFDLFVWYRSAEDQGEPLGFQLCYDKFAHERAVTWHQNLGFSHSVVDTGDDSPKANRTPVLVRDGAFPDRSVLLIFEEHSRNLEPAIMDLVMGKLEEYLNLSVSPPR
jgi:hypothetical protein